MLGRKSNHLVVIEKGQLSTYELDNKLVWNIGRSSKENNIDIKLHSMTVSRQHGRIRNMDGTWFYIDLKGKNGTIYNNKHIKTGLKGRIKPITLKHGDVLIFGGGEEAVINNRTIWSTFLEYSFEQCWVAEDTKDLSSLTFTDGEETTVLDHPKKGTVIEKKKGIAIYMGEITYLNGNIRCEVTPAPRLAGES